MLRSTVALAALLIAGHVLAQTVILDQNPAPAPTQTINPELMTQSIAVTGGTLYVSTLAQGRQNGGNGQPQAVSSVFVPSSAGGITRWLPLTGAKSDVGVGLTATPGSSAFGVTRTAGTSLVLTGEATSASAKTDKAVWEISLPDSYVAGANVAVTVNANYTGAGTVTAASTTITLAAYTVSSTGGETALTVSPAQQFTGTATNYVFTITGTGLVPGQRVIVEPVMLVTTSAGAATGQINSVSFGG